MIRIWLRKGNFTRETEPLLIVAQHNAIRNNYIKAKRGKTQQNNKFRLPRERDEKVNHLVSECSKLLQKKYKTRYEWLGKMIHWEL